MNHISKYLPKYLESDKGKTLIAEMGKELNSWKDLEISVTELDTLLHGIDRLVYLEKQETKQSLDRIKYLRALQTKLIAWAHQNI